MKEWSEIYNPFNSNKLIYHVPYWESIKDGVIPPPILVTLDPINRCNFGCSYCNASFKMNKSSSKYDDYIIDNVGKFLKDWGTKAVCIAGGGEPLLHTKVGTMINNLDSYGVEVGVVTNGFFIDKFREALSLCKWVGVSIDAGDRDTFAKLKNVQKNSFDRVVSNIRVLTTDYPDLEVTYKFLAHPTNIYSIYDAVKMAKKIGCKFFHLRPVGKTWDDTNKKPLFSSLDIKIAEAQINQARKDFEDSNFKIFGVLHKFSKNWNIKRNFKKCWAVGMTAVIQPDNIVGLCCDRRGDPTVELGKFNKLEDIVQLWNSEKHWDIMKSIDLSKCPRCTYGPHNTIFEHMIVNDHTCKNFI
jgi:MoaA/NifB/PqqE/SkfB family radical SAM enzyme